MRHFRNSIVNLTFNFRNSRFAILKMANQGGCWIQQRHMQNVALRQKQILGKD